jgi:hypothetical protein
LQTLREEALDVQQRVIDCCGRTMPVDAKPRDRHQLEAGTFGMASQLRRRVGDVRLDLGSLFNDTPLERAPDPTAAIPDTVDTDVVNAAGVLNTSPPFLVPREPRRRSDDLGGAPGG